MPLSNSEVMKTSTPVCYHSHCFGPYMGVLLPFSEINPGYGTWVEGNCNAHRGIWFALDDDVKQAFLSLFSKLDRIIPGHLHDDGTRPPPPLLCRFSRPFYSRTLLRLTKPTEGEEDEKDEQHLVV